MRTLLALICAQLVFAAQLWSQTPVPSPSPSADRVVVETTSSGAKLVPYTSGMKFREATARASGLVNFSNSNRLFLFRGGKRQEDITLKELEDNPSTELMLEPWDIICRPVLADCVVMACSDLAFVSYTPGMKLSEGVGQGGGLTEFANTTHLVLVRGGKKELINLRALRNDPSKEPVLQPWDIIYLPPTMW